MGGSLADVGFDVRTFFTQVSTDSKKRNVNKQHMKHVLLFTTQLNEASTKEELSQLFNYDNLNILQWNGITMQFRYSGC